uniref:Cilia and flagella associated protein 61 n=1 Tax=Catharus ustulatus TaxID=91951 RepID=A0A8C3UBA4_CATUS
MATVTSWRGHTEVVTARRTEPHDVPDIVALFSADREDLFGRIDVPYLLELSNLALTLCNEKNEVLAHAAFLDYPNWNITDQAEWEPFLHKNYPDNKCTPLNTLFVHLLVAKEEYAAGCSQEIVRSAFILLPELQFILLFLPSEEKLGKNLILMEDYDDLVLIWTPQSEALKETYGEYVLDDLIEREGEENQAAVCEVGGTAVGFMSLCSHVNISLYQEWFDLGPFHGLCKPHPEDILKVPRKPSVPGDNDESNQASEQPEPVSSQDLEQVPGAAAAVQVMQCSEEEALAVSQPDLPVGDAASTGSQGSAAPLLQAEEGDWQPVYRGASNVFLIRVFCIDEKYETRSLDFLQYAFSVFPDRELCAMLVPPHVPELPLLQSFVRAVPSCTSPLGQELFVFHRAGLLTSFNVRKAVTSDLEGIKTLVDTLSLNDRILDDSKIFTEARRDCCSLLTRKLLIFQDIEYIRAHYNIEDFIGFDHHQPEEHGHLCHFVLNPVVHHYTKYFLKEILRLGHKSSLYYPVYPEYVEGKLQRPCAHSLTSALHYMAPVRPRRQIVYPLRELGANAPSEQLSADQPKYSLNHTNRRLVLESKVCINTRIVVVGASDVGISFLETLIFWPRLKFNNLTLISTHGLPGRDPQSSKYRRFLINSHCFNDEDYAQMSLCSWVNVVVGKMTGINRRAKYVVVSKEKEVPYDYLVLCTGESYQVSCVQGQPAQHSQVACSQSQRYSGTVPCNHFTLNDAQDCLEAARWLEENLGSSTGNVIVYGNTADMYTTVEALLSLGVDGSRIHLVQAPLGSEARCLQQLQDAAVQRRVQEALAEAGVAVHPECVLAQWEQDERGRITGAAFGSAAEPLQLQCSAFFSFAYKTLDYEASKAISDAYLVLDGRLVIDAKFHTNDPSIRAAGPLTKFSRRYWRDDVTHSNFNSKEIGSELAASMLSLFDPSPQPSSQPPEGSDRLIPVYTRCKVQGGVLPGGYNYLHISKPGVPTSLDVAHDPCEHVSSAAQGNYFRMHLSRYSLMDSITCLCREPLPVSNYVCLFGQHERLLNDLCHRWSAGQITDLYSYFREPWSMAIYHDWFIDLQKELRQILMSEQVRKTTALALSNSRCPAAPRAACPELLAHPKRSLCSELSASNPLPGTSSPCSPCFCLCLTPSAADGGTGL